VRYTAATITQAMERPTIRLGRSDHALVTARPWGWRVQRWWLQRARTWTPLLLSAPQMLALQASRRDPVTYLRALAPVLRAVFPWRTRYRLTGDPVRHILRLPADLMGTVLSALFAVPGSGRDGTQDEDDFDALRALQRRLVRGDGTPGAAAGPSASLATAAMTCRAHYGEAWYYAPGRWPTADGYVPFAVVWVEYMGLQALGARRVLEAADGYVVANARNPQQARRALQRVAYPPDPVH
jgi:hypothetical protein